MNQATIFLLLLSVTLLCSAQSTEQEAAKAPTISPKSGVYTTALTVSIDCPSPDLTIYYTLDGSPPNQESIIYTQPFTISTHTHVRATTIDRQNRVSSETSNQYLITTLDSDNDGMDDTWELAHFNSLHQDGKDDFDTDGSTDLNEFNDHTDPLATGINLSVDYPLNNDTITANNTVVSGSYVGGDNIGITINNQSAILYNRHFYANKIPLSTGENILKIKLFTTHGLAAEKTLTVRSLETANAALVSLNDYTGIAPHTVRLSATNNYLLGNEKLVHFDIDFDGDAAIDVSLNTFPRKAQFTYKTPGVFKLQTTALTENGKISLEDYFIVVQNSPAEAATKEVLSELGTALKAGHIEKAILLFTESQKNKFRNIFALNTERLYEIGTIVEGSSINKLANSHAQYIATNATDSNRYAYPIQLIKGLDGVWRIESM